MDNSDNLDVNVEKKVIFPKRLIVYVSLIIVMIVGLSMTIIYIRQPHVIQPNESIAETVPKANWSGLSSALATAVNDSQEYASILAKKVMSCKEIGVDAPGYMQIDSQRICLGALYNDESQCDYPDATPYALSKCVKNIRLFQAITKKDTLYCDQLEQEPVNSKMERLLCMAIVTKDISNCQQEVFREDCLQGVSPDKYNFFTDYCQKGAAALSEECKLYGQSNISDSLMGITCDRFYYDLSAAGVELSSSEIKDINSMPLLCKERLRFLAAIGQDDIEQCTTIVYPVLRELCQISMQRNPAFCIDYGCEAGVLS